MQCLGYSVNHLVVTKMLLCIKISVCFLGTQRSDSQVFIHVHHHHATTNVWGSFNAFEARR